MARTAVVDRVALDDSPAGLRAPDHLRVVQPHDRPEAGQPRRDHLRAAAEAGEEVRLDEPRGDADVRLRPGPVQPDRDAAVDLAEGHELGLVERVVDDDAVAVDDVRAEHLHELVPGRRPVGAARDHDRDAVRGHVRQGLEHHRQHRGARHRPRDVADRDGHALVAAHALAEGRAADGLLERLPDRPARVGQTVDIGGFDDRRAVVRKFHRHPGAAVGEIDQHDKQSLRRRTVHARGRAVDR